MHSRTECSGGGSGGGSGEREAGEGVLVISSLEQLTQILSESHFSSFTTASVSPADVDVQRHTTLSSQQAAAAAHAPAPEAGHGAPTAKAAHTTETHERLWAAPQTAVAAARGGAAVVGEMPHVAEDSPQESRHQAQGQDHEGMDTAFLAGLDD